MFCAHMVGKPVNKPEPNAAPPTAAVVLRNFLRVLPFSVSGLLDILVFICTSFLYLAY